MIPTARTPAPGLPGADVLAVIIIEREGNHICCIAYQPPADAAIPDEQLDRMWGKNRDGAGYMFAAGGRLIVRKPFFKLADLRAVYAADHAKYGASSAFVIHFRWSTHGKNDAVNTHPHILANGKAALVHNGILYDFAPPWKSDVSDTVMFCRTVLWGRQPSQLTGRRGGRYLAELIGAANKLVLMDYRGNVSIVNEQAGLWDGGRWYSNGDYLPAPVPQSLPPFAGNLWGKAAEQWGRPDEWDRPAAAEDDADELAGLVADRAEDIKDALLDRELSRPGGDIDWEALDEEAWKLAKAAILADA